MVRGPVLVGAAATLAAMLLLADGSRAQDARLLARGPRALVDATGQVIGQAFLLSDTEIDEVLVWTRIDGRDLLLLATSDSLIALPFGKLAFADPSCGGSPWFLSDAAFASVFVLTAPGPGSTVFAPDGPEEIVVINSSLNPSSLVCEAEAGAVLLQPAVQVLDLTTFTPPYAVR